MDDRQGSASNPGPETPRPGKLSEDLLEAGLRAFYAAGAHQPTAPPQEVEPELPARIGRYDILEVIGRGGTGVVLKGWDAELRRDIAIKLLLHSQRWNSAMKQRFIEEAQVAGQLEHPGIVSIHETGLLGGDRPYFSMKLVKGRTLAALLKERPGPEADRVRFLGIFEQVAQTVAYAHSRSVIHRDLKPANIMVGAFGEVQVMDWGLAKVFTRSSAPAGPAAGGTASGQAVEEVRTLRTDGADSPSLAGSVMGTPAYMSPEQARGEVETLDARTDVFGLGAILCDVLTGTPPFQGKTTEEVFRRARGGETGEALRRLLASGADREIISLARACLAVDRKDRPVDAGAVAEAMKSHRESLEERARRSALDAAAAEVRATGERKARRLTVSLAAVVVASVLLLGGGFLLVERSRQARLDEAERLTHQAMVEAEELRRLARSGSASDAGRWQAALQAARRARDLAAGAAGALRQEASQLCGELEARLEEARFVEALEAIRAGYIEPNVRQRQDSEYARAFLEHLGNMDTLGIPEAAALIAGTGVAREVASALDDWAHVRRMARGAESGWRRLVEIAARTDPHPWRMRLRRAVLAERVEELVTLAESVELEETSAPDLSSLAWSLRSFGELSRAESLWRRAQDRYPDDFWVNYHLGAICAEREPPLHDDALRFLTVAVAIRPGSAYALHGLARIQEAAGDLEAAQATLIKASRLHPDARGIISSLAKIYLVQGELAEAEATARRALELGVGEATYHNYLATVLRQTGKQDEAIEHLRKAVALQPASASHHNGLGYALFLTGRRREAIDAYRQAIAVASSARPAPGVEGPDLGIDEIVYNNLGHALLEEGKIEEAVSALRAAVAARGGYALAWNNLGLALRAAGRAGEAISAFETALRLEPGNAFPVRGLLYILEALGDGDDAALAGPIESLLRAVREIFRSGSDHHDQLPQLLLAAWSRRPAALPADWVLHIGMREADRTERRKPEFMSLLAQALDAAGRPMQAVRALEECASLIGPHPALEAQLERYRASFLPDLPTYRSIDAALATGPREERDAVGERFRRFRETARGEDAPARLGYLEARLLQREGRHGEAEAALRRVLALDRSDPAPFLALWESFRSAAQDDAGADVARRAFREAVVGGPLPGELLPVAPERPRNLEPPAGAHTGASRVALLSTPFDHLDPRVEQRASRWQVWVAGDDPSVTPVIDVLVEGHLERIALPDGLLLPRTTYLWRVRKIASRKLISPFSLETGFATGDIDVEPVRFDLSQGFSEDVVADPGDESNEFFDGPVSGSLLVADGFDGERPDRGDARGLPRDGVVGVHRLGSYDGPNTVSLSPRKRDELRLAVPPGRYVAVRFLVTGANGRSSMPLTFKYGDGTSERVTLPCADWFDDQSPEDRYGALPPGVTPAWNGMDRLRRGVYEAVKDPALFEVILPVREEKALAAFALHPREGTFETPNTVFHLFAATGMRSGASGDR